MWTNLKVPLGFVHAYPLYVAGSHYVAAGSHYVASARHFFEQFVDVLLKLTASISFL